MKKLLLSLLVILGFGGYVFLKSKDQAGTTINLPISSQATPTPSQSSSQTPVSYKDGTYTGDAADAFYGNIQVQTVISGGKITDVKFLQAPNGAENSIMINGEADPMLKQEAITKQSANVDIVSGATQSSEAFIQSLQSALDQAKI